MGLFSKLVGLTFRLIRWLLPLVLRLLWLLFSLAIVSLTSIYMGIPQSVNRIADSWLEQAVEAGIPLNFHPAIRTGAKIIATVTLVMGWVVLAVLTVMALHLIFG